MEYRDQLKYIKSHQIAEDSKGQKKKQSSKKRKNEPQRQKKTEKKQERRNVRITSVDRFLWGMLILSSACLFAAMAILGVFPSKYMAVAFVFMLVIIIYVKFKQMRACHSHKKRSKGKGIAFCFSILFLFGAFYLIKANFALDQIAIGEESGEYTEEHLLSVTEAPFNVYISGIDVYGEIDQESRSDVNIIATINPKTHKILLTTTPRDYYVTIPGVSGGQRDKLTHAGIYGIDTSMATLENLYQTDIPFFIRVNFTSVIEIVDAMGGVNVESDLAFTTGKESGAIVEIQEGTNHLNGQEALAFVRERKAFVDGDNQRGKNQQALLTALIKEVISPMIVLEANEIINCITGNAETNMSEAQIKSLLYMQLDDMKGWEIESVAATGDDSGKQYCYSYSGNPLYVTVPDAACVEMIIGKIDEYLQY